MKFSYHNYGGRLTYQYETVEDTHSCPKCKAKGYLDRVELWG